MQALPEAYASKPEVLRGQFKGSRSMPVGMPRRRPSCRPVQTCRYFGANVHKPSKRQASDRAQHHFRDSIHPSQKKTSNCLHHQSPNSVQTLSSLNPSHHASECSHHELPDSNQWPALPAAPRPQTTCPVNVRSTDLRLSNLRPTRSDHPLKVQTAREVPQYGWRGTIKLDPQRSGETHSTNASQLPSDHCRVGQACPLAAAQSCQGQRRNTHATWSYEMGAWVQQGRGPPDKCPQPIRQLTRRTPRSSCADPLPDISNPTTKQVTGPRKVEGVSSKLSMDEEEGTHKDEVVSVPRGIGDIQTGTCPLARDGGDVLRRATSLPSCAKPTPVLSLRRLNSFRRKSTFREFSPWTTEGDCGTFESETDGDYGSWQLLELLTS